LEVSTIYELCMSASIRSFQDAMSTLLIPTCVKLDADVSQFFTGCVLKHTMSL